MQIVEQQLGIEVLADHRIRLRLEQAQRVGIVGKLEVLQNLPRGLGADEFLEIQQREARQLPYQLDLAGVLAGLHLEVLLRLGISRLRFLELDIVIDDLLLHRRRIQAHQDLAVLDVLLGDFVALVDDAENFRAVLDFHLVANLQRLQRVDVAALQNIDHQVAAFGLKHRLRIATTTAGCGKKLPPKSERRQRDGQNRNDSYENRTLSHHGRLRSSKRGSKNHSL